MEKQERMSKKEPKPSLQSNIALVGKEAGSVLSSILSSKFNRQNKV